MSTVTKDDLIKGVMNASDLKRGDANKFVDDFFQIIVNSLESGENVKISGFGNFVLRNKKARMGRNPKTGKEHLIESRTVVSFHSSNVLKTAIRAIQNSKG